MEYPKMTVEHDAHNWWVMAQVDGWTRPIAPIASILPLADNPEHLARLFAAAPAMLDALEQAADICDRFALLALNDVKAHADETVATVRAALKAAKPEAE